MSKSRNANWPSFDGDDNPKMKAPPELIYELTLRAPVCRDMGVTREQWLIHAAYAAGIRHIERELLRLEVEAAAKLVDGMLTCAGIHAINQGRPTGASSRLDRA